MDMYRRECAAYGCPLRASVFRVGFHGRLKARSHNVNRGDVHHHHLVGGVSDLGWEYMASCAAAFCRNYAGRSAGSFSADGDSGYSSLQAFTPV